MNYSLPYSDTLDSCTRQTCTEDFWREKASRVLNVSEEYFNLFRRRGLYANADENRNISPAYRYLELAAPLSFPQESLALADLSTNQLLGVYESYYAFWLAVYKGDRNGIDYFYSVLDITSDDLMWLPENLTLIPPRQSSLYYLTQKLEQEEDFYNPDKYEYLEGLSRLELLERVEHWDSRAFMILAEEDPTFDLLLAVARSGSQLFAEHLLLAPQQLDEREKQDVLLAALSSGNINVFYYYEQMLELKLDLQLVDEAVVRGIQKYLLYTQDVQSVYEIYSFLPKEVLKHACTFSFGMTVDLALLILSRSPETENYYNILLYNLGNIDLLLTLLPQKNYFGQMCIDISKQEDYFPLGWNLASSIAC